MIETCAQIHRKLWYSNELAVAQGYGKNPRDEALLKSLAIKLSIPDESFILSDESKAISAQQYLMAMLEVLEPLSVMFQDIWNYCERSMTKTSKNTLDISWNFNIKGDQVTINFEAFRRYRQLLEQVPESNAFNNLCNGFADACRNYQENRPNERPAKLPAKPKDAMPKSVASRIYDLCESVRDQGLEKSGYWGTADAVPALWAIKNLSLWDMHAFAHLQSLLDQCAPNLKAEDILDLPFWRHRWQIYELWCLVTTLQLFARRGFELNRSPTGAALLELGQTVVVAERKSLPFGQIIYQPSYLRRAGKNVQPDIVVVRGTSTVIQPDDVAAIIECKQHKMPDDESLKTLKKRYFDGVAASYADAVATDGALVLVNYDNVDFPHDYTLIDEFRPQTRHTLAAPLAAVLNEFSQVEVQPQPVLIIDGSSSMEARLAALRDKVGQLHSDLLTSHKVICLPSTGPLEVDMNAVGAWLFAGSESVELFTRGVRLAKQMYPLATVHIITDLKADSMIMSELAKACIDIPFQVHCI